MLANYLKQLRQRSRLATSGWAMASGISRTTLWRWEQGKTLPRDEELRCALKALSATTDEQKKAMELLLQERAGRAIGAVPSLKGVGIKPNELLRALRQRRRMAQREAAELLGVHRVTLANWEAGDHWPETSVLHTACWLYEASPSEIAALTTLSPLSYSELPTNPDEVTWDDIETYNGDFAHLELRYLTSRAQLAQMTHKLAREREITCTLDYLHSFMIQSRLAEMRRELRRLAAHPVLQASPTLFAYHKRLLASSQAEHPSGNQVAEKTLRFLLAQGDSVPLAERCRAKATWAERRAYLGDYETALRLSAAALMDAEASGDAHLLAIAQREHTAVLINTKQFPAAEKALNLFPTHTQLFAVQKVLTGAMLLHEAGSRREAASAYAQTARAAETAGISGYAQYCSHLATTLSTD